MRRHPLTLTFSIDEDLDGAVKPGHLPHPLDGPLGLDKRREDAGHADEGDCEGVVVVVIDRPQEDRGDLKNVEGVQDLYSLSTVDLP